MKRKFTEQKSANRFRGIYFYRAPYDYSKSVRKYHPFVSAVVTSSAFVLPWYLRFRNSTV